MTESLGVSLKTETLAVIRSDMQKYLKCFSLTHFCSVNLSLILAPVANMYIEIGKKHNVSAALSFLIIAMTVNIVKFR